MDTSAPLAQTGRSGSNRLHRSFIFLSFPIICFNCGKVGHKASMCPQKKKNKKHCQAIQGSSTAFHHYRTSKYPRPFCRRDALAIYIRSSILRLECQVRRSKHDSTSSRNVSQKVNICAPMSYPPTKQGRGAALTAEASRNTIGQVDEEEEDVE